MSFLNEYNSEITGIVFEDPLDKVINDAFDKALGGGSSTSKAAKAGDEKRWLESYSPTQLRYAYRAGYITEDEWQAELVDRGETQQSARAEVEKQKTTGISTAASTRGQLTASEQAGVNAMKAAGAPAGKPAPLSGVGGLRERRDEFSQPWSFEGGKPSGILDGTTGGRSTPAASSAVGPGGRTFEQTTGKEYVSDAERQWYLAEAAKRRGTSGGGGGSAAAPRATGSTGASSGGGTGTSSSSGGGGSRVASTGKDDAGGQFAVRGEDGHTYNWREYTRADGSTYYKNLQTGETSDLLPRAVAEKPVVKKSPLQLAAEQLQGARATLSGGPPPPTASGLDAPTGDTRAPAPIMADNGSRLVGLDMPGYGTLTTAGKAGNNVTDILGAAHIKPTGDAALDLETALGALGRRLINLEQNPGMTPGEYQSLVDRLAWDRAFPAGGGYPNYNTGFRGDQVSTPTHDAGGRLVIDDQPGDYRSWLRPEDLFANGGGFDTQEPVVMMGAISKRPLAFIGGTGEERIQVTPKGPHGSPSLEAEVGDRMWPQLTGAKPYATGIEDLLQDYVNPDGAQMFQQQESAPDPRPADFMRDPDYPGPLSPNSNDMSLGRESIPGMPRGGDPDVAGSQGPSFGGANPSNPRPKIEIPYMAPMNPHVEELIIGRHLSNLIEKAGIPGGMATLMNQPMERLADIFGPRALRYFEERVTPNQWRETDGRLNAWESNYFSRLPRSGRTLYQAGGAENRAGDDGWADSSLGWLNIPRLRGMGSNWENITGAMQNSAWAHSLPGSGNPWSGGQFMPALSHPWLINEQAFNDQWRPRTDANLAPLNFDAFRELGTAANPNANFTFSPPQLTYQQALNMPAKQLAALPNSSGRGPATMADGGMGEAGMGMMAPPPPTDFAMLLETLMTRQTKANRRPPQRPVGATMVGGYAA